MAPRRIPVVERIMSANDDLALANRAVLDAHGVHAINIMASPGAGKTTLLLTPSRRCAGVGAWAVIEGDLASTVDTDKVRAVGVPAVQINTGGGCHLDAPQVQQALERTAAGRARPAVYRERGQPDLPGGLCPGRAHASGASASVPEGDDKPHKYPAIFANVDALVITKIDLLPYIPFDLPSFAGWCAA